MTARMDLSDFEQRLSQVEWKKLRHAYGSARDLPAQLMAVARGEDDGSDFFGNLYHQGTVYSSTAVAVPFLADLVLALAGADGPVAEGACDPATLVTLLRLVARGVGYFQVHGQLDWMSDGATPRVLAREKKEVTRAHLAVCAAWPRLASLAQTSHDMRIEITALAGELYGIALPVWDWLQALLATESDALSRCAAWEALGQLLCASKGMSAYADRRSWPEPLPLEGLESLHRAWVARLRDIATQPSVSAAERWCAVDLLLQSGEPVPLDVPQLAALQGPATALLGSSWLWEERRWLQSDPALRLDVLTAGLKEPLPDPAVAEALMEVVTQSRLLRARAVTGLVGLLAHPSPDLRLLAARHLQACGTACQPHAPRLWLAGQADAALRPWLLAPLRACGEVLPTVGWLSDELDAGEAVWSQPRGPQCWDTPDNERRLLRAVASLHPSDAEAVGLRLQGGLDTWLDRHPPLTQERTDINLPVSVLLALERLNALPWRLLARSLQHGLPGALSVMARRAESGAAEEREEAVAQVRAHADDLRMHKSLRQGALLSVGDEAARAASLSELMECTLNNTSWDVAQWWAQRPQQVPPALLAHWRGFLAGKGGGATAQAAHGVWCCAGRNTGTVDADVLQALLGQAPNIRPLERLAFLREMAPFFSEAQRAQAVPVLSGWLADPIAPDHTPVHEDEQWLGELRVLLEHLGSRA